MKQFVSKRRKHLIIGNSAAALNAIKALRQLDNTDAITVVSGEESLAYSPVLLTYYLSNKIPREDLFLAKADFYKKFDVELILGRRVIATDLKQGRISLEDGKSLEYDNLLLATGSSPKKLGVEGEELLGIFCVKTLKDAELIRDFSTRAKNIVMVGGGLISLQTANAFITAGKHVSMVIGSKHILSQNLDDDCAELVEARLKKFGVNLLFENVVSRFSQVGNRLRVHLNAGAHVDADMVIVGRGVVPNIDFLSGSGIDLNKGILVDSSMRTNIPNVYAAGDVAEAPEIISGSRKLVANWINACLQGETAGINMLGREKWTESLRENITTFQGVTIGSIGLTKVNNQSVYQIVTLSSTEGNYRKIIFNDGDQIIGAVLLGRVEDIGIIKSLIKRRIVIPYYIRKKLARTPLKYGTYLLEQALFG